MNWTSIYCAASFRSLLAFLVLALGIAFGLSGRSPEAIAQSNAAAPAQQPSSQSDDSDSPPPVRKTQPSSTAENVAAAWATLTSSAASAKVDPHIQSLAAIGTLGASPHAEKLILAALKDPNLDVRTAAILAAGQSKDRNLTTPLRAMLDDKEPQVAFTAATTLWKMNDHSGEDILVAVIDGERRSSSTLMQGALHTANDDLHSPSTLAKIGALQGASMLLGPFGFGITAYEYIRKNGGDSARVLAIEQLSEEKTRPIRDELVAALGDKDPTVRAAAAKALGTYREPSVAAALANLFYDPKAPVRLTAAAAYLCAMGAAPGVSGTSRVTQPRVARSAATK